MVAQHHINIGPMYRVIWEMFFGAEMASITQITIPQSANKVQPPNYVSMSGQRRRLGQH